MGTLALAPVIKPLLGDVPAWLALGWIQKESAGRVALVDRSAFPEGEMSLFQLSPDERKSLGVDEGQLLSDPVYSITKGLELINQYSGKVAGLGIPYGTDFHWWNVKLMHGIGAKGLELMYDDMRANGAEPSNAIQVTSYFLPRGANDNRVAQAIKAAAGAIHYPSKWIGNANLVYGEGKTLAATAGLGEALKDPRVALPALAVLALGGLLLYSILHRKGMV